MKKIIAGLLLPVLLLSWVFLAGCSLKIKDSASETPALAFNVGVSGTAPPFGSLGKDGNPEGFDIDIINAIAEAEGCKAKFGITNKTAKIPALQAKQFDILISAITITNERKKEVDFSDPYFESRIYLLVPADSKIRSVKDLKGKTVACSMATTSDFALTRFLGKNYQGIKRFKRTTAAFLEVTNRRVDAAAGDSSMVTLYVKQNPEADLKIVRDTHFPKEYYGMAVRKGDRATLQIINRGLRKIKETGRYQEIYKKWFEDW